MVLQGSLSLWSVFTPILLPITETETQRASIRASTQWHHKLSLTLLKFKTRAPATVFMLLEMSLLFSFHDIKTYFALPCVQPLANHRTLWAWRFVIILLDSSKRISNEKQVQKHTSNKESVDKQVREGWVSRDLSCQGSRPASLVFNPHSQWLQELNNTFAGEKAVWKGQWLPSHEQSLSGKSKCFLGVCNCFLQSVTVTAVTAFPPPCPASHARPLPQLEGRLGKRASRIFNF